MSEIDRLRAELAMRRKPLSYPGDEAAVKESGLPYAFCSCAGRGSDDAHHEGCNFWKMILAARSMWEERHVIAWSCSQEAKGRDACKQWCGQQHYCTASTRDDIDIAVSSQFDGGSEHE